MGDDERANVGVPDFVDRLIRHGSTGSTEVLSTLGRSLRGGELLARIGGAARALSGQSRARISFAEPACWVPWVLGAAFTGTCVEPDRAGVSALPDEHTRLPSAVAPADQPWLVVKSSGTTGRAKALVRDRMSWLRCFSSEAELFGLSGDDRFLVAGANAFSLAPYGVFRALHLGACVAALPRPAPTAASTLFSRVNPTVIYAAPPLLFMLARSLRRVGAVNDVRLLITGGTRLSAGQLSLITTVFPNARVMAFYGAAETSFIAVKEIPNGHEEDDMGELFPGVEGRTDSLGRLCVRSPYVAQGRLTQGDGVQPITDGAGWVHLSDLGSVDRRRHVWLKGRFDGAIDLRGTLVPPDHTERVLESLPWVAEAVVLPVVTEGRISLLGVLVPVAPLPSVAAQQLRERSMTLPAKLRPERFLVMRAPPRTAGGKIDRTALARASSAGQLKGQTLS